MAMTREEELHARSRELSQPIHQQIMMCDNEQDVVLLASAMLSFSIHILDQHYGFEARNALLQSMMKVG
jgi:hypothetical protein